MVIQWFPGHMTKALRMMQEEIKLVDIVLYVLDARAPYSCVNPEFAKIIGSKPVLFILNKADLADEKRTKEFLAYFNKIKGAGAVSLNSTQTNSGKLIEATIRKMLSERIEKYKNKGINTVLRGMVLGVPNSGKSTLINNLVGGYKAITGNKPGVTKGKQWLKMASGIELLDTPGTLWPSFEREAVGLRLAYIGSIKDEVVDQGDLALELIKDVLRIKPQAFSERYRIKTSLPKEEINQPCFALLNTDVDYSGTACPREKNEAPDTAEDCLNILQQIAGSRGFLTRGGEFDYERCARAVLDDFRKGRLGRITLDSVDEIQMINNN